MRCSSCGAQVPVGARFCPMCAGAQTPPQARERRHVSVLFIDLVGFSRLASVLETEELRDLADAVLSAEIRITQENDGRIDNLRGDGVMAVFGAPRSHPDDATRAVRAAVRSLATIREIGREHGLDLEGRAGVNTGVAIAGAVGSSDVRSYTVMGSVVNLAAKLEAAAAPGDLLVGEETYLRTRHLHRYEAVAPVAIKGAAPEQPVYRLVPDTAAPEVDAFAALPLVGRERQLDALTRAYRRAVDGGAPVEVWLVGPAGSGKTRLLNAFLQTVETMRVPITPRYSQGVSWRALEGAVFGTSATDHETTRRQLVTPRLEALLPQEPRWQNAVLTSLDLAESKAWTRLDRRIANRTTLAWRDLLSALASPPHGTGLIVTIDNETSDDGIEELVSALKRTSAPILIVRSTREKARAPEATTIDLDPLTIDQSLTLVDRVSSPSLRPATEALVRQVTRVPGNVLELGRALWDADPASFAQSLENLLQSHLDMLDVPARRLFTRASLVGKTAWDGLLMTLEPNEDPHLLEDLVDRGLIVVQDSSRIVDQVELAFGAELLRKAASAMIPLSERPRVHLQIATWLEQNAPTSLSESIAQHFQLGGSSEAANVHYLVAAELAADGGDFARARKLFERALALEAGDDALARTALTYADTAVAAGERGLAVSLLERARRWIEGSTTGSRNELDENAGRLRDELRLPN